MNIFDYGSAEAISIADFSALKQAQSISDFPSCEYSCVNLIIWSETYDTKLVRYNGRIYAHMVSTDEFLFPLGGEGTPCPDELREVSRGMQSAGFSGILAHAPEKFIHTPGLENYYEIKPMDDTHYEYIYRTEMLAGLHGSKLSKKRNLISQFERNYEQYEIKEVKTMEDFRIITELSNDWLREHLDTEELENERKAIARALKYFEELGLQGLMLETSEGLKAFAIFSRLNSNSYTIHFEKAIAECKGASQMITNQTAVYLRDKCEYINREQDLGIPGLRQAKQSYMPDYMLKDYLLIPK